MAVDIATSTIIQEAFRALELSPPSSLGDDSEEARSAVEQYPNALSICLEANDWSFASRQVTLPRAALPADLAADATMAFTYRLPTDCIRLIEVLHPDTIWRVDEGRLLRANRDGGLDIRYTRRVENEDALPASFRIAVAYQLALLLAGRWLRTQSRRDRLYQMAEDMLDRAKSADKRSASTRRWDGDDRATDWVSGAIR